MDLTAVANAALRVGATDARAGAERIALSPRLLLPLLQGQALGNAALAELARDVRAQLVRGESAVTLVLPPGAAGDAQPARIDLGTRQVVIPAALRDALLAQLAGAATSTSTSAPASMSAAAATLAATGAAATTLVADEAARAWVVSAQTQAATTQLLAGQTTGQTASQSVAQTAAQTAASNAQAAISAGAARELLRALAPRATSATRDQAMTAVGFDQPVVDAALLETTPVAAIRAIGQRLQQQLERSGLFFESHIAQWTRGVRTNDELRAELVQINRAGAPASEAGAQRVSAQLAALEHGTLALSGPAWPGQSMQLVIERERPRRDIGDDHAGAADASAGMPPVFNATLALQLPHLGRVQVDLRLAGKAVATMLRTEQSGQADAGQMAADLEQLAEQFRARGLTPVAAHALPFEEPA
jgi:hypothetical protein